MKLTEKELTELLALAEKATFWESDDEAPASNAWKSNRENNARFCRSASPERITALVEFALEAKKALKELADIKLTEEEIRDLPRRSRIFLKEWWNE